MTDKEQSKYFNKCKKLLMSIIKHKKYESFSNNLSEIGYSILRTVGKPKHIKIYPTVMYLEC